ncbi:putative P-loop containing nucleoside triphosphate hydrolase protein [Lyophyllum shimeji]|uniref:P-loop containing nucleoside triphosphate hydrolase protein n=1 Tax=Lyophyllum shimeji TaxID=47721 RepID=A0A9P3PXP6_LYOSH|nr:putative P-loop containing nucleoside triphosphate hydrolase protein [Lyophyllum shimeji]
MHNGRWHECTTEAAGEAGVLNLVYGAKTQLRIIWAGLVDTFTRETNDIRAASSLALGQLLRYLMTTLTCLVLALTRSWTLTLPPASLLLCTEHILAANAARLINRAAGAMATVKAFGTQSLELRTASAVFDALNGAKRALTAADLARNWSRRAVMAVFWACLIATSNSPICIPRLIVLAKGKEARARPARDGPRSADVTAAARPLPPPPAYDEGPGPVPVPPGPPTTLSPYTPDVIHDQVEEKPRAAQDSPRGAHGRAEAPQGHLFLPCLRRRSLLLLLLCLRLRLEPQPLRRCPCTVQHLPLPSRHRNDLRRRRLQVRRDACGHVLLMCTLQPTINNRNGKCAAVNQWGVACDAESAPPTSSPVGLARLLNERHYNRVRGGDGNKMKMPRIGYPSRSNANAHCSAFQTAAFTPVEAANGLLASIGAQSYQPWVPDSQIPDQDEAEDGVLDSIEGDNSDVDAERLEDSDSEYEGTDSELLADLPGRSVAEPPEFSEQVTEYLQKMRHWMSTAVVESQNNPYQRNKIVLYTLTPWSRQKESSSSSFSIAPNGQILTLQDSCDDPLIVNMQQWRRVVIELCSTVVPDIISTMIPDVCLADLQEFDFTHIQDDFTPISVYSQETNAAKLKPLILLLSAALLSPSGREYCLVDKEGKVVSKKLRAWLLQEQRLLAAFAAIFVLASGPCFRSFQFSTLRYNENSSANRNLFFFSSTSIGLANPQAKQMDIRIANTALLFPPSASHSLHLYFFVLRAVGEHLLNHAGIEVPGYSSLIWVNTVPD